jgi:hypothetical protein
MSRLNINNLTNENEDGSPRISGISTFSSTAFLETPKGTTAQRPENVAPGMIRFNTDSGHLEYYTGEFWDEVLVANNTLDGGNRGITAGGSTPGSFTNNIDYYTIPSLGNSQDFGDLTDSKNQMGAAASRTIGLFFGGYTPSVLDKIEKLTIASTGSSVDSGADLINSNNRKNVSALSNQTRYVTFGGRIAPNNFQEITYGDFSASQNAVDFGDPSAAVSSSITFASSVRGISAGGFVNPTYVNTIDYITISTLGDAQDFGDISVPRGQAAGFSNSTRGVCAGGYGISPIVQSDTIDFITISSTGNAQDFGDLSAGERGGSSGCASPTRGVIVGGGTNGSEVNTIEYITISTTGNSIDFGDMREVDRQNASLSNGHGGL